MATAAFIVPPLSRSVAFLVVDLVLGFVLGLALPQLPPPDDCAWNS